MGAPTRSVCNPWATPDDACTSCNDYSFNFPLLDQMLDVASDILFELSGRQFTGTCTKTVYPCSQRTYRDPWPDRSTSSTGLYITPSCGCGVPDSCGCGGIHQIQLGAYPVTNIDEVKVDGAVVPESSYRIDGFKYLVRTDGEPFPCCSDLSDLDNAFSVTFDYGLEPPPAGVQAAADLACQLALACDDTRSGECKLPQRVTSLTRQGVSMVLLDPFDFLENGRTGVYSVDLWLSAVNPRGLRRPPAVLSPDIGQRVRRVNT